jgi:hypothetical protein
MRSGDGIVQDRVSEFRTAFLDLGYGVPDPLTAQMALSPSLNASATYYLGQDRHHIAINAALMLFVRRMARIASLHFPFDEQTAAIVGRDEVAGREFAKLLLEVSGFAQIDPTNNFTSGSDQTELADECERLAQGQVVGHELAHVCLGHLGSDRGTNLDTAGGRIAGDEIAWAQAEEVAADFWGMLAQLRWADAHLGTRLALAIWAGDYFMASLGFWEKFEPAVLWPIAEQLQRIALRNGREISFGTPVADTDHPPMDVRRELLREHLKQALKSDVNNSSELAIAHDMSIRTDDYIAALWQSAKEPFQQGLAASLAKRT